MVAPVEEKEVGEHWVEILPTGRVRRRRTYALGAIELSLYILTCQVALLAWSRAEMPPVMFALMVAFTFFGVNILTGVYRREVYVAHVQRLIFSGVALAISTALLFAFCEIFIQDEDIMFFVLGMALLSYVTTNTLRPVLVEVIRAGTENEKRRQPAKTIS